MPLMSDRSSADAPPATLALTNASVRFGGILALDALSFTLRRGEILGLIGPNGAGKTTAVNALTGFQPLTAGDVCLGATVITGWPADRIARAGVARTFQAGRLFRMLSVGENVQVAAIGAGLPRQAAGARARVIIEALDLAALASLAAGSLSHGEQQRVGIARALALAPNFLLLDEPASGLNEDECGLLIAFIREIPARFGCGVLLIEHNMRVVMSSCERVLVLDGGKLIGEGTPAEIRANTRVRAAYLGSTSAQFAESDSA